MGASEVSALKCDDSQLFKAVGCDPDTPEFDSRSALLSAFLEGFLYGLGALFFFWAGTQIAALGGQLK